MAKTSVTSSATTTMEIVLRLVCVCGLALGQDEWSWGSSNTVAKPLLSGGGGPRPLFETPRPLRRAGPSRGRVQYEVYEEENDNVPPEGRPGLGGPPDAEPLVGRPGGGFPIGGGGGGPAQGLPPGGFPGGPGGGFPGGPGGGFSGGPGGGFPGGPGGGFPGGPGGGFPPNDRPGPPRPDRREGVLTGPNPSWQHPFTPSDPTHFDTCKCVHSFNCKSPGLQFGRCDAGKQYCCYNSPKYGLSNDGRRGGYGSKFGYEDKGLVLTGPSSPDRYRPDFIGPDERLGRRLENRKL